MRLGAFLPPWGRPATPEDFDQAAASIERLGYDSLWIGDHVVFPRDVASRYPYNPTGEFPFDREQPLYEPLTLLAYLAALTSRVGLGVSVLVLPMRNPVLVAKALADVDALARGRLRLAVGVGWLREEFAALGSDFEARGEVTDEWVAILRHLWTQSAPTAFTGRRYRFAPVALLPRPSRPLPILVGGNSKAAMRRAVRLGDGWHGVRLSPEQVRERVAWLAERLGAEGRDGAHLEVVLRTRVTPSEAGRALQLYASAGVDELIVEVPDAGTEERLDVLARIAEAAR